MAITLVTAARNAAANAVVDLLNSGTLVFMTSGDVAVATLGFATDAFAAASSGVATANSISSDTNAVGGTVAKFAARDSGGNTIFTGTVTGTNGGGDIELSSLNVGAGDTVSVSSLTYTMPQS